MIKFSVKMVNDFQSLTKFARCLIDRLLYAPNKTSRRKARKNNC